jgi:hypothetical protein
MIILTHDRSRIVRFDVTRNPTAGWLARQVTEAFPWPGLPQARRRDGNRRGCQRGPITVAECARRTRDRFDSP